MKEKKKSHRASLQLELEPLVERATIAEATEKVLEHLERATAKLDTASTKLLEAYWAGATISEIAREWSFTEGQVKTLIGRAKQQLCNELKSQVRTRQ